MRVGVVFGGRSVEHEVSIVTAHQLMAVLSERHEVVPIYISREGRWLTGPGLNDLDVFKNERWDQVGEEAVLSPVTGSGGLTVPGSRLKGPRKVTLDVVIPAVHGTFGEDGTLQGVLEMAGLPYVGSSVTASAVGMDKVAMKAALTAAGLPVVPDVVLDFGEKADIEGAADRVEQGLTYPVFVKPVRAGSSVGIGKASSRAELIELIEVAGSYDRRVLVEKAMEGCIEINCSVLGGASRAPRPSVCEQPVAWEEFLSFEDKYMRGGSKSGGSKTTEGMASLERQIPAPISEELTKQIQDNAVRAFRATGAEGVARVDSFVNTDSGETWVMEINTTPGSFSFYLWEASGLPFADLAQELIDLALERHHETEQLMYTFDSGMLAKASLGGKRG